MTALTRICFRFRVKLEGPVRREKEGLQKRRNSKTNALIKKGVTQDAAQGVARFRRRASRRSRQRLGQRAFQQSTPPQAGLGECFGGMKSRLERNGLCSKQWAEQRLRRSALCPAPLHPPSLALPPPSPSLAWNTHQGHPGGGHGVAAAPSAGRRRRRRGARHGWRAGRRGAGCGGEPNKLGERPDAGTPAEEERHSQHPTELCRSVL